MSEVLGHAASVMKRLPTQLQEGSDAEDMVKLLRLLEPSHYFVEGTLSEIAGRLDKAGFSPARPVESEGTGFTPAPKAK